MWKVESSITPALKALKVGVTLSDTVLGKVPKLSPLVLIPLALSKVRDHHHTLILIDPHWPLMSWLPEINQLLCSHMWQLLLCRDMLFQGWGDRMSESELYHLGTDGLPQTLIGIIQSALHQVLLGL